MAKMPKILIVEDSRSLRTILKSKLKDLGASISEAENGEDGLNMVRQDNYDLVLSDVDMPVMNGLEMCQNIKSDRTTRGTPVILLSSMERESDVDIGFEVGASAYVPKSNAKKHLLPTIKDVLHKSLFNSDKTILIVDDSRTILRLAERGLAKAGFNVVTARNGKKALDLLKRVTPHIIISDLDMPVMNGFEFRDRLTTQNHLASIPFIVMSANGDRASMRGMVEKGAAAYLVKPFSIEQLVILTEKLLSNHVQLLLKEKEKLASERKALLGSITSLVHALEARDLYTRGHSERVEKLVISIAEKMEVTQTEHQLLMMGSILHDLGKIGIPDGLLLKKDALTEDERKIFQQHPVIGCNILQPITSLKMAIPIILHHHERYDGSGYPDKLKGKNIPIWARITAVADTYDALTTDRPYRKGFPREIAMKIIDEVKGTQLCPECVNAFINTI